MPPQRILFMQDLRELLPGLGDDTLYALLAGGDIAARKVGNKWVATPDAVDAWVANIARDGSAAPDPTRLEVVR